MNHDKITNIFVGANDFCQILDKTIRDTQLCCWAYARREFEKALPNDKARAEMALMWIQQLYKIERDSQNLDAAQRKKLRFCPKAKLERP